ncbi:hypothetical protein ACX0G9_04800 [Flavitalea flava]
MTVIHMENPGIIVNKPEDKLYYLVNNSKIMGKIRFGKGDATKPAKSGNKIIVHTGIGLPQKKFLTQDFFTNTR